MIRDHSHTDKRSAFTMVELMVVILIIAILVSLISSAVMRAMGKIPEVQTRTEISQMAVALQAFMTDYSLTEPPPSLLSIREDGLYNPANPLDAVTINFFQTMFGRTFAINLPRDWNNNAVIDPPYILQGQQCLVFYLGGIPTYTVGAIGMSGFADSNIFPNLSPTAAPTAKRKGPYFTFINARLFADPRCPSFPVYQDPWQAHKRNISLLIPTGIDQPYAYFSSGGYLNRYNSLTVPTGGDCASVGANAYYQGFLTGSLQPSYLYPNSFQIISAGKDGIFGFEFNPATGLPIVAGSVSWFPASGGMPVPPPLPLLLVSGPDTGGNIAGLDDQTNFTGSVLSTPQN